MDVVVGGVGVCGGMLGLVFGGSIYVCGVSEEVLWVCVISFSQYSVLVQLLLVVLEYGYVVLLVEQLQVGGFDNLFVFGDICVVGDVDLCLVQSLCIYGQGILSLGMVVDVGLLLVLWLSVFYVCLVQVCWGQLVGENLQGIVVVVLVGLDDYMLVVQVELIDICDVIWLLGFEYVVLESCSDVCLINGIVSSGNISVLMMVGLMDVIVVCLYFMIGVVGMLVVGVLVQIVQIVDYWVDLDVVLCIYGIGVVMKLVLELVLGMFCLVVVMVQQGGNVQVLMGMLQLGGLIQNGIVGSWVELLLGSVILISGVGLLLFYGGIVDGVDWWVGMCSLGLLMLVGIFLMGVILKVNEIEVVLGVLLDMFGGGELIGVVFVLGCGGFVDVLCMVLVDVNLCYEFSVLGNLVYVIVLGCVGVFVFSGEEGFVVLVVGQQIIVLVGVFGLVVGIYMLMLVSYVLQFGVFWVELGVIGIFGIV